MGFAVVIPSRYASIRLPGKALRLINGKPMLEHVYRRARESQASEVVIATDDERIAEAAAGFGALVCMTGDQHRSGTERIAEAVDLLDWPDERIVVNLQGDEPAMPAALIDQCAALLADSDAELATLASPLLSEADFRDPNVVKVLCDGAGYAIYFSRATIPYPREPAGLQTAIQSALHHHGIYANRCGVLRRLVAAEASAAEITEQLEQLRALDLGMKIRVGVPDTRPGPGVDTENDLIAAAQALSQ